MNNSSSKSGFALVTLAIILSVAGILLVAMLPQKSDRIKSKLNVTSDRLKVIQDAIGLYYETNSDKYPCPASRTKLISSATFGNAETCYSAGCAAVAGTVCSGTVNIGAVPTRTLGLSDEYMVDEWGQRFNYAVDVNKTAGGNGSNTLVVKDLAWTTDRSAAYYVFSSGPNGKGGFNLAGNRVGTCTAIADPYSTPPYDFENCDDDANFIDDFWQSSSGTRTYDDIGVFPQTIATIACPSGVAGCSLWLAADDIDGDEKCSVVWNDEDGEPCELDDLGEPTNGTTVTTWVDKSDNGWNAAGTGGVTFATSQINTLPALYFGGQSFFTPSGTNWGTELTAFILFKPSSTTITRTFLDINSSSFLSLRYDALESLLSFLRGSQINFSAFSTMPDRWALAVVKRGSTGEEITHRLNGITQVYDIATTTLVAGSYNMRIGYDGDYSAVDGLEGHIAEVAYYPSDLSDASIEAIECYFSNKYGLNLTNCGISEFCPAATTTCPGNISGCQVWYRADDINTLIQADGTTPADGEVINTICDKSGNNNHGHIIGTVRYNADGMGGVGYPAIRGADVSNTPTGAVTAPYTDHTSGFTVFISTIPQAIPATNYINVFDTYTQSIYGFGSTAELWTSQISSITNLLTENSVIPNAKYLLALSYNSSTDITNFYLNGEKVGSRTDPTTDDYHSSVIAGLYNGDVGEYAFYGSALTEQQIQTISQEMAARWNIPLAAPYSPSCSGSVASCTGGLNLVCSDGTTPTCSGITLTCASGAIPECSPCAASNTCPIGSGCTHWFNSQNTSGLKKTNFSAASSNGDVIGLWCDLAAGNHATAIGSPTLQTNAFGSYSSANLTNESNNFIAQGSSAMTSSFTITAVVRPITSLISSANIVGTYTTMIMGNHSTSLVNTIQSSLCYINTVVNASGTITSGLATTCNIVTGSVFALNTSYIMSLRYTDNATLANRNRLYNINGVARTNVTGNTTYNPLINATSLAEMKEGIAIGNEFNGYIGEVAIYPSALSAANLAGVECQMAQRWGLCGSLAVNYCNAYTTINYCCNAHNGGGNDANSGC